MDPGDWPLFARHRVHDVDAEALCPEGRLKRLLHLALVPERGEHAFAIRDVIEMQCHAESGWLRELSRRRVGALQDLISDLQRHVHHAAVCVRRHVGRHR